MAASTTEPTPWPLLQRLEEANLVGLADAMGISVSTASRMVDRLVAARWVRRVPSPSNRREVAVSLTAGGHRILEHYGRLAVARGAPPRHPRYAPRWSRR
jgi:DNA-binding MarR family transcriptional regulator